MIGKQIIDKLFYIKCLSFQRVPRKSNEYSLFFFVSIVFLSDSNSPGKIIKTSASEVLLSVPGSILLSSNKQKKLSIYMRYSDLSGF